MRRILGIAVAGLLSVGTAVAANGQEYIAIYGGYGDNDSDSGADASIPYGISWGGETPVAGGQVSLQINRDGSIKMDTLLFSVLLNFASRDSRTKQGRIIFNRSSAFVSAGTGVMRFDDGLDTDLVLALEVGVGTQIKFNRRIGLRIQAQAINTPSKSWWNYQGTLGLAFYW